MDVTLWTLKRLVGKTGAVDAGGYRIVRPAASARYFTALVLVPFVVMMIGSMMRRHEVSGMMTIVCAVAVWATLSVWWRLLRWNDDAVIVRRPFRRARRFEWESVKRCSGTDQRWCLEMFDGTRYRGNEWTSGGAEFFHAAVARLGRKWV